LEQITKRIVARELNMYFRKLRHEDMLLSFEDVSKFDEEQLDRICFSRGINIDQTKKDKEADLKLWLSISNLRNVPNSLLLFARINDFNSDMFQIEEDETYDEVLRRSKSDAYYIESLRVFEKAFGMDRLQELITEMTTRYKTMEYNPAEDKYVFTEQDLQQQADALSEFITRHSTITERIEKTYRLGLKLTEHLEKQIILDFHFRG
jgi:hypothetical protein